MTKKLIPVERHQQILQYMQQHGVVKSSSLVELLKTSEATIRRDLERLERHGLIERTHGGAILVQRMQQEAVYSTSASLHQQEKKWIASAVAGLIEPDDTIFINNGTTTTEVLRAIQNRPELQNITVFTNNVSAAMVIQDAKFKIYLLGGLFRPHSTAVVGQFATTMIEKVFANKAIIGVDGIAIRCGCTTPIAEEAEIGQSMIDHCLGQTIVVADNSKWGVIAQYQVANLREIDILVSDTALQQEAINTLAENEVQVVLAGAE